MNRPSFNVLKEGWIPVIHPNGTRSEVGILDCLIQAHAVREIRDPAPIVEFGLYRLLVAFVLDLLILAERRPEDTPDLEALLREGHFDSKLIETYVQRCGDAFDLFHPERPFLQTVIAGETEPLAGMYPAVPNGTNVGHWHHQNADAFTISAPEATRLLTTISPFMTAGGKGKGGNRGKSPSINGAPAIYALPLGRNLYETLIFNIPLRQEGISTGAVAWRSDRHPGQERSDATMVEALTWRPRNIQLVPTTDERDGMNVREMRFDTGDSTRFSWIDPSLAYRYGKEKPNPIRMQEDRPVWRDAGALLLLNEGEHQERDKKFSFRRPDVVQTAFAVASRDHPLPIATYGMRTDMKMKIFEWMKSTWSVPVNLGRSTQLGSLVQSELDRADRIAYGLRSCVKALYPREGASNKKALGCIVKRCERAYWQQLEPRFQSLMNAFALLGADAADDSKLVASTADGWRCAIRDLATEQFELASRDMDADSDALERLVNARSQLYRRLRKFVA